MNAAEWLSDGEYRRRLPEAQAEQMAAIARALRSSAPAAMAEPFGRDPLFAPPAHAPGVWAPLAAREIGPEEAPLQIEAGQVFLDKTRYPQALKQALASYLISPEAYKQAIRGAYLVQAAALEDRQLRELAGPDAEAKAVVGGLGKGAVSVGAGALTGAGVAAVAPESGFTSLALVPGAAMAAGDTAGQVYDAVLPESWQAAAKLHPWLYGGGELAPLVATAPLGLAKTLKAARLLQQSRGTVAAAKLLAKPAVAGAVGTAAAQGMNKLADPDDSHFSSEPIVLGAALGPASAGLGLKGEDYAGLEDKGHLPTSGELSPPLGLDGTPHTLPAASAPPPPPPYRLPKTAAQSGRPAPPLPPAGWSPTGAPISDSVVLKLTNVHEAEVREAMRAQDMVHGDGPLIPKDVNHVVRRYPGGKVDDSTYYPGDHIGVLQGVRGAGFHFLHESGHWIANEGVPHDPAFAYASNDPDSLAKPVMDSIIASDAVKGILKLPQSYYRDNYLLKPEELWARAYAQFVTLESWHPALVDWLDDVRLGETGYEPVSQWDSRDFQPIAREFRALFKKLGWMVETNRSRGALSEQSPSLPP